MSVDKYKFISPGIFTSEIDNTGRTATPEGVGPAIIGRAEKGPALQPVKVDSFLILLTHLVNQYLVVADRMFIETETLHFSYLWCIRSTSLV